MVAENVINLQFNYYDNTDTLITAALTTDTLLDSIRTVEIIISIQVESPTRMNAGTTTADSQFRIRIRNAGL